jgi:hypothetical protein
VFGAGGKGGEGGAGGRCKVWGGGGEGRGRQGSVAIGACAGCRARRVLQEGRMSKQGVAGKVQGQRGCNNG